MCCFRMHDIGTCLWINKVLPPVWYCWSNENANHNVQHILCNIPHFICYLRIKSLHLLNFSKTVSSKVFVLKISARLLQYDIQLLVNILTFVSFFSNKLECDLQLGPNNMSLLHKPTSWNLLALKHLQSFMVNPQIH